MVAGNFKRYNFVTKYFSHSVKQFGEMLFHKVQHRPAIRWTSHEMGDEREKVGLQHLVEVEGIWKSEAME
jgi:hypothetical protein